jgi:hypothetical protein
LTTLRKRYLWVQRLLSLRGFCCMPLPQSPLVHSASDDFLIEIAKASALYVVVGNAAKTRFCSLESTALAVLWQQARLNYMLPALAQVACVGCALQMGMRGASSSDGYIACAQIEESVLWLRRILAPDLDDALGVDGFSSKHHVQAELARLVSDGILTRRVSGADRTSPTENQADDAADRDYGTSAADGYEVAMAASGKTTFAFCAALLAPLVCTYAAVLDYMLQTPAGEAVHRVVFMEMVLEWLQAGCEGQASAIGPVPSKLLVQHAVDSWTRFGLMQHHEDPGMHREFRGRPGPARRRSVFVEALVLHKYHVPVLHFHTTNLWHSSHTMTAHS